MIEYLTEYHGLYAPPDEDGFKLTKIIFLDIDGVLVNRTVLMQGDRQFNDGDHHHNFDPHCMKHLENIIDVTDAYIVISSTWRKRNLKWAQEIFKTRGFKYWDRIIGETCRGYHFRTKERTTLQFFRGNEIDAWIRQFVEQNEDGEYVKDAQYHYVILDDDSDILYWQRYNFIHTSTEHGLSKQNAVDAAKILSGFKLDSND